MSLILKSVLVVIVLVASSFLIISPIQAQLFSGSDISNYKCPVLQGVEERLTTNSLFGIVADGDPHIPISYEGRFLCFYNDKGVVVSRDAIPNPSSLRVLQIWFVRIIAVVWGLSGIAFTGLAIWIGFKYMTSFGNEYQLGKVIEDFRKWMVGLAIVFLSYPFLVTFFRLLPLSNSKCYDEISLPGFQFFFPEVCYGSPEEDCEAEVLKTYGRLDTPPARADLRACIAAIP